MLGGLQGHAVRCRACCNAIVTARRRQQRRRRGCRCCCRRPSARGEAGARCERSATRAGGRTRRPHKRQPACPLVQRSTHAVARARSTSRRAGLGTTTMYRQARRAGKMVRTMDQRERSAHPFLPPSAHPARSRGGYTDAAARGPVHHVHVHVGHDRSAGGCRHLLLLSPPRDACMHACAARTCAHEPVRVTKRRAGHDTRLRPPRHGRRRRRAPLRAQHRSHLRAPLVPSARTPCRRRARGPPPMVCRRPWVHQTPRAF
eukprot:scaffold1457_cov350-Prasinococcus_capsulatus_cf.AAC.8